MREGRIFPTWTDLVQRSSQSVALENIEIQDTWFTADLKENPRETQSHDPIVGTENNNKALTSPHYELHEKKVRSERERLYMK